MAHAHRSDADRLADRINPINCKKGIDKTVPVRYYIFCVLGSSSGLGHRPLTAVTRVRLPYRVPGKSVFCRQTKGAFSMISVPDGTGNICFAYDIPSGDDIRLRRMEERISYRREASVYHIAQRYIIDLHDRSAAMFANGFTNALRHGMVSVCEYRPIQRRTVCSKPESKEESNVR